jgi:DNA-binding transcriptional regulator YhcF (GntR family)
VRYRPRVRDLTLDKRSNIPLYLQLKHHIVHLISSGEWMPGMAIPSVRQVASELSMATATVQRTYAELQAQGLLVGQAGRGVFVAELAVGVPVETREIASEREAVLHGLLARSVSNAQSLGFRADEIVAKVRALAASSRVEADGAPPRVVFVGIESFVADKYCGLLRDALADLHVEVDRVLLDDLEQRGDAALDEHEPIRCLVSLVGTFADLRRLAGHRGTILFGLVLDLTADAQQRLVDLPTDEPIGLVAEERYLPSARAALRQYLGTEEHLLFASASARAALRRLRGCRLIVYTLGAKRAAEHNAAPEAELIELQFRPNPNSIARLRGLLSGQVLLSD